MGQRQVSIQEWANVLGRDNTDATVKGYKSWAKRFKQWIDHEPDISSLRQFDEVLRDGDKISELNENAKRGTAWSTARPPENGYSYSARVKALSAAKSWLAYAHDISFNGGPGDLVNNIAEGEYNAFDPEIAGPGKVAEILDDTTECNADSCHAMARISYDAILRVSEVVRIKWDDVDLERGTVYVRAAKGSQNRHVGLSARTVSVLRDYRDLVRERFDDPEWLFYGFYQRNWNHPWKAHAYSAHFRRNHWEAGHHSFARHSAITNRLRNGESLTDISQRARHSSLKMTQKYNQFARNGDTVPPELR
jgi:integrase